MARPSQALLAFMVLLSACLEVCTCLEENVTFYDPWADDTVFQFCILVQPPFDTCESGTFATGEEEYQALGYNSFSLDVFKRATELMGVTNTVNWTCCGSWDRYVDAWNAYFCDAGIDFALSFGTGDVERPSRSISRGGDVIVVLQETKADPSSYWAFMEAFTWQLWVAILATCLLMAVTLWGIERWTFVGGGSHAREDDKLPTLHETMWLTLGRGVQTADLTSRTFVGGIVILVFAFQMLIMTTMYQANTAANLTAGRIEDRIESVADLRGRLVGLGGDYSNLYTRFGVRTKPYEVDAYDGAFNYKLLVDALLNKEVDAVIVDIDSAQVLTTMACGLEVVGDEILQVDDVIYFQPNLDPLVLHKFDRAILQLVVSGELETLAQQHSKLVLEGAVECPPKETQVGEQITFREVAGLWILLAAGTAVALVLGVMKEVSKHYAKKVAGSQRFQAGMGRLRQMHSKLRGTTKSLRVGSAILSRGSSDTDGKMDLQSQCNVSQELPATAATPNST